MVFQVDFEDKRFVRKIVDLEINYEDVFHYKQLYRNMHDWFKEDNYKDAYGDSDHWETLYWERVLQTGGKDHHLWWRLIRLPEGENPKNPFIQYYIKIEFRALNMKQVEVVVKGKRVKTNKGELSILIKAYLLIDPYKKFRNHWLLKHFINVLLDKTYKRRIEAARDDLKEKIEEIVEKIKQYLELVTPKPTMKLFHPEKGIG